MQPEAAEQVMAEEMKRREEWRLVEKSELTEGNVEVGAEEAGNVGRTADAEADGARDDGGRSEVHVPLRLGGR